ncbi:AMP-binding protein [Amycolatopsis sp. CA-128772]|uniref:AMP-binding protein n=1 Tax=Amycolatopsis sp. CA-128772 TaxID=2073159 RepID=UPI001304CA4B|nr:AMP-binding protein [Amycolatopsis sp. CA-128772]
MPLCWDLAGDPEAAVEAVVRALARAHPAVRHEPVPWRRTLLRGTPAEREARLTRLAWRLVRSPGDAPVRIVLAGHGDGRWTLLAADRPDVAASGWAERLLGLPRPPAVTSSGAPAPRPAWQRDHPLPPSGPVALAVPVDPGLLDRFPGSRAEVVAALAAALVARYGRCRDVVVGVARGAGFGGAAARPVPAAVRLTVAADQPVTELLSRFTRARPDAGVPALTVAVPEPRPRASGPFTPRPVPRLDGGCGLWLTVTDGVTCWFDAGPADPERVAVFGRHLAALLRAAEERRHLPLARLRVLGRDERVRLLPGAVPATPAAPVAGRIRHWARTRPDAAAVVSPRETVSYRELARRATALAARLHAAGVGPDVPVGLWLPRSADLVTAAVGVLLAGGAHVALDAAEPAGRVRALLARAGAGVVITPELRVAVVDPDAVPRRILRGAPGLCCVAFTASADGVPVSHEAVANVAGWCETALGFGPGDRVAQLARTGSGAWELETWSALAAGATLAIAPEGAGSAWLARSGTTVAFTPHRVLHTAWPAAAAMRLAVVHGRADSAVPQGLPFRVWQGYGSPETGLLATCGELPPGAAGVPIGAPLPDVRAYVLDEGGEPVPPGAVGELHVGGAGVARGHLGRPGRRRSPFSDDLVAGGRRYATGDLVRRLGDGTLELLGHVDEEITLRGFRIVPGEVEAALRRNGVVGDAAVVARGDRLVAYVTPSDADPEQLRRDLVGVLPAFMVPDAVVPLATLPRTTHGLLDHRALAVAAGTGPLAC